jgi:tetratricopeptide (TPR) repeat protein
VPARPDSAPPESEPAPFLSPATRDTTEGPAKKAREAFDLGRQLEANGAFGAAIVSYLRAIRLDPAIPDANYRAAMLYLTRDQVAEAAKHLAAEVERHPANSDAIRELALCLARLGDTTRALQHLERLVKHEPKVGKHWQALGFVYLAAKRPADAERALREALRLPPETVDEHRDLGAALAAMGRNTEARAEYRRALRLDSTDASTWLNLGNLERRAGDADSALACYRRAEACDSSQALALQGQIQILRGKKRDAEAADAYLRWLARHPDHHGARLEAVMLLDELDREDQALAVAREGIQRNANSAQPHVILSVVLKSHGDTRGAVAELRQAETLFKGIPAEQERVRKTIAAMRRSAPDSLRAFFVADSTAAAAAAAPVKH